MARRNCCSAIQAHPVRHPHPLSVLDTTRELLFLPAANTLRTMLPMLVRLKEFREFTGAARNAIPAALNFSNASQRTRYVCPVFSEIFFLLATWTLTKLLVLVVGAQPNFRLRETNDPGLVSTACLTTINPSFPRYMSNSSTISSPTLNFRPSAFSPLVG